MRVFLWCPPPLSPSCLVLAAGVDHQGGGGGGLKPSYHHGAQKEGGWDCLWAFKAMGFKIPRVSIPPPPLFPQHGLAGTKRHYEAGAWVLKPPCHPAHVVLGGCVNVGNPITPRLDGRKTPYPPPKTFQHFERKNAYGLSKVAGGGG